jgi:hypothetical protein
MLSINIYFKNKPDFRPPSPTKTGWDNAWVAPIIGCPFPGEGGYPCADGAAARHPYHKIACGIVVSVPTSVFPALCGKKKNHFSPKRIQFQNPF